MSPTAAARRIGWLLRANRRLGNEEALRSGRAFASAFRGDQRPPAAPSQVSRWESGQLSADRGTIRRYERMLGLAPGSLATVADIAIRSAGGRLFDHAHADPDQDRDQLFDLLDRATTSGTMTGADWCTMTELIARRPQLELYPPRLWDGICWRLLDELFVAVGTDWLQRQEAMSCLLEHPASRPHAIASCIAQVNDDSSPALIEPLTLLEITPDPVANAYVLRHVEHPGDERTLEAALYTTSRKLTLGQLRPAEQTRLAADISALMRDPATNDRLLPLVVHVGRGLAQRPHHAESAMRRLLQAPALRQVWTARRITDPAAARAAGIHIAAQTHSRQAPDSKDIDHVLAELAEEALFHSDAERRFVATTLIAATPYRLPFAHTLLDEVRADLANQRGIYPLALALQALTVFGVDIHRPLIQDILTRPWPTALARHAAAWATPFCHGKYPESTWRQIFTTQLAAWRRNPTDIGESILHAVTYGIGTDGHHQLLATIRHHPHTPPIARTMASSMLLR